MQWNKLRSFLLIVLSLVLMACVETTSPSDANLEMALEMSPQSPVVGESELTITLTDTDGTAITDATLEVVGDMNHAGMVPVVRDLTEADEDGVYRTPFEWSMGGDWFVTVVAFLDDGTEVEQTFDMTVAMAEGEEMDHSEMDHSADNSEDEGMGHDHDDESHAEDKSDEGMGHDHDDEGHAEDKSDEGMDHDHDAADTESDEDEEMGHDHDDDSHADEEKSEDGMSHDHDDESHAEDKSDEDAGHEHGDHSHGDADAEDGESSDMDHSSEMDGAAMAKMIDTSELHEIDEAVRAGNMEPEYLTALEEFAETLSGMELPAEYETDVEALNTALADLTAAMEAEDMEAVQPLVAEMHDIAHDLKIRLGKTGEEGHDGEHSHD